MNNRPIKDQIQRVSSLAQAGHNIMTSSNLQMQPNYILKSPLYKNVSEQEFKSNIKENANNFKT